MRERKRRNFNQAYKSNIFFGRGSIIIVSIVLFVSLLIMYSLEQSAIIQKTSSINDHKAKIEKLAEEHKRLEDEAIRLQSIQEIQKSQGQSTGTKYVPVQKINYLPSSNVAVR